MNAEMITTFHRMKRDLDAAARIQRSLLPTVSPVVEGARLAWDVIPSEELAGDSLNFVRLDDHRLGVYILDVSGHGLEAALLAVTLHKVIAALTSVPPRLGRNGCPIMSPVDLCTELNRIFPMNEETTQYFTLLYGILDTRKRIFRYVAAGHHAPIYVAPDGRAFEHSSSGFPIGIRENADYEEAVIELEPSSRLYLYSDGLIDASCCYEGPFGKSRLMQTIAAARHKPLRESVGDVIERVRHWSSTARLEDDASLLAIELA
jgi:sigma-B regulation protein RsbU (phosphoserine phosphatase)